MKRSWLLACLLVTWAAGCSLWDKTPPVQAPELKPTPPAPVRASHVTHENAHAKARALSDELDRDLEGELDRPQ
jgi:hypothetical protein